jgi:hypothetical protein
MNTQWLKDKTFWTGIAIGAVAMSVAAVSFVVADDHLDDRQRRENKEIEIRILSSEAFENAEATIEWSEDSEDGYHELEIEINELPAGDYALFVGGEKRGVIAARTGDDADDAEGEIEFYSDGREGALPLDFEVFGQLIEIKQGETVVFSVMMPASADGLMQRDHQDDRQRGEYRSRDRDSKRDGKYHRMRRAHQAHHEGIDRREVRRVVRRVMQENRREFLERHVVYLENTGIHSDGKARTSLLIDEDGREFEIDLAYVPSGEYRLVIDGTDRGLITVASERRADRGGLSFADEPEYEEDLPLDFEVKGALIEVFDNDALIFRGQLY